MDEETSRVSTGEPSPARETDIDVFVRQSRETDVPAMLAIYRYHIGRGIGELGDYEVEEMHPEDLKRRRKNMRTRRLPHLVAERGGAVAGYAYAVPFRKRPAYRYAVKHSIYVHHERQHLGIGRMLLLALVDACAAAGYRQMIGYIDGANDPSLHLHESCGFQRVGLLPSIGYKFGHWSDSVMVQRSLGPGASTPPGQWTLIAAEDHPTDSGQG